MPLPSGLSALIQAATSQFGHLVDDTATSSRNNVEPDPYAGVTTDDGASSDGGEKHEDVGKLTQTPLMVPEPDPLRHTFPELLMTLAIDPRNSDVIAFLPDGKFFALRVRAFTENIMKEYFPVTTFEEFLDLTNDWGFTRILQDANETGIEVFRHPQFIQGDFVKCKGIKFGENPTEARVSALPEAARIEYTASDDSNASAANTKRRLSPGFMQRRESESSTIMKRRLSMEDGHQTAGRAESENGDIASYANQSRSDEIRSVALALTTEKLNLHHEPAPATTDAPFVTLVDQAVKSATHTIVTDAIETLLNDEVHTKETYQKHEKELSKSSLPGVVPISKVLFDKDSANAAKGRRDSLPKEVTTRTCGIAELSEAAAIKAEELDKELREESERQARRASLANGSGNSLTEKEKEPTTQVSKEAATEESREAATEESREAATKEPSKEATTQESKETTAQEASDEATTQTPEEAATQEPKETATQ